jgi:hypothetical protein
MHCMGAFQPDRPVTCPTYRSGNSSLRTALCGEVLILTEAEDAQRGTPLGAVDASEAQLEQQAISCRPRAFEEVVHVCEHLVEIGDVRCAGLVDAVAVLCERPRTCEVSHRQQTFAASRMCIRRGAHRTSSTATQQQRRNSDGLRANATDSGRTYGIIPRCAFALHASPALSSSALVKRRPERAGWIAVIVPRRHYSKLPGSRKLQLKV